MGIAPYKNILLKNERINFLTNSNFKELECYTIMEIGFFEETLFVSL